MPRLELLGLLMLIPLLTRPCRAGEVLTLRQALAIAVAESPLIASSRHEVEAAKQNKRAAIGRRLPQIDLYASAQRLSDPQTVVPISSFGGKPPLFSRDQYGAGVSFRLPVYQGGRLARQVTVADLSREVSQSRLRLTRQDLIANVTNTFNGVLYLQALIAAEEETLSALEKSKDDAAAKLHVGRLAPVDLMRIETQVAEQKQALIRSREEERRSRQTIALLLGWTPSREPDAAGTLTIPASVYAQAERVEAAEIVENRPDVRAATQETEKAETEVKLARGLHLPSVEVVADYSGKAGSDFEGSDDLWSAGVALNLNLFSGGTIAAEVSQAKAGLAAARERLRQVKLNARTEVVHAASDLREARHRLDVAASARATAEETFRIEELRYRKGAGTVTDSLLAQAAWLEARTSELGALFDVQKAAVEFRLAAGTIDRDSEDAVSARPE